MKARYTRRQCLQSAAVMSLLASPLLQTCKQSSQPCMDPELLSTGEKHLRKQLAYLELSEELSRQCGLCQFYQASELGDCGKCTLLDGSVSMRGSCTSWASDTRRQS